MCLFKIICETRGEGEDEDEKKEIDKMLKSNSALTARVEAGEEKFDLLPEKN